MVTLSVVIPVYNAEKYLRSCIDSVIQSAASYTIEILLVNDGSKDQSEAICKEYESKYSFIRAIHKKNEGVSNTRNRGIAEAIGEYITFMDADDLMSKDFINDVFGVVSKNSFDLCIYEYQDFPCEKNHYAEIRSQRGQLFSNEKQTGAETIQSIMTTGVRIASCWGCIYQKEFLHRNQLGFEAGLSSSEDTDFIYQCLSIAKTVCYRNQLSIIYRRYVEGSLSNSYSNRKLLADLVVRKKWLQYTKRHGYRDIHFFANDFVYLAFQAGLKEDTVDPEFERFIVDSWEVVQEGTTKLAKFLKLTSWGLGIRNSVRLAEIIWRKRGRGR